MWYRGLIKAHALGKLTGCEYDFACLVWQSSGKCFLQRSSAEVVLPASCPPTEKVNETPCGTCSWRILCPHLQKSTAHNPVVKLYLVPGVKSCKPQWFILIVSTQNHMNGCPFLKIPCVHPECGMHMKKADLTEHLEKECKCRLEPCGFCKRQINLNKMKVG